MKQGANKPDQYQIKKGYEAGMTPTAISVQLGIAIEVVESFAPVVKDEPSKDKPKGKASTKDA